MRLSWDEYFMEIAEVAAKRSTCLRRHVGAVAVRDKRVLATGYNGAPTGLRHCSEVGCLREAMGIPSGQQHELCRGLHAEQNVIIQAARHGISIEGAVLYLTHQPCILCAKMIINAGIVEVVFEGDYPDKMAVEVLEEGNVKMRKFVRERGVRP